MKANRGFNQLALPEARSTFNGLLPSKMAEHPAPHGKR